MGALAAENEDTCFRCGLRQHLSILFLGSFRVARSPAALTSNDRQPYGLQLGGRHGVFTLGLKCLR